MENGHRYWNDETVVQGIWNLRDPFKSKGCMLVPLTTAGAILPPELANDVLVLDEALPTREELESIVKQTYADAKMKPPVDGVMEKILDSLVGLAAFPSEQTLAMCLTQKGLDTKELWNRKCQVIEQTPVLSIWKGVFLEKVIGVAKSKLDSSSPLVSAGGRKERTQRTQEFLVLHSVHRKRKI
jgi:hypothetical protein